MDFKAYSFAANWPSLVFAALSAMLPGDVMARSISTIPFVGCVTQTTAEPVSAPTGNPVQIDLPPDVASRLALYAGANLVVLGPRGWSCSAEQDMSYDGVSVFPKTGQKPNGPVVSIQADLSDDVHTYRRIIGIGRTFFPKVITEAVVMSYLQDPITDLNFSDLPKKHTTDRVRYFDASMVAFKTQAGKIGLGDDILDLELPVTIAGSTTSYGFIGIGRKSIGFPVYLMGSRMPGKLANLNQPIVAFSEACFKEVVALPDSAFDDPGMSFCSVPATYASPQ